jgi:predicted small secreted protein
MMQAKVIALFLLLAVAGLSGCNTMRGMGQDIEATGDKIENTAERAKK